MAVTIRRLTVKDSRELGRSMRRITLQGDDLADFPENQESEGSFNPFWLHKESFQFQVTGEEWCTLIFKLSPIFLKIKVKATRVVSSIS